MRTSTIAFGRVPVSAFIYGLVAALSGCGGAPPAHERSSSGNSSMQMLMRVEGDGRPLVLIGGGLTGWLSWAPHQERLRERYRVGRAQLLSVQLGLEGRPLPASYSISHESAALKEAVDAMQPDGAVDFVAWSFGALVTLNYALDHPERVRSLTLIEPPAFWVLEATGLMDDESRRERDALERLHRGMVDDVTEEQLADFVRSVALAPPGTAPEDLPSWPLWMKHRRSLLNGNAVFSHRDTAARLRAFDRPVLLVKGTGSSHGLHQIIDTLADTLPHTEVIEFPGGHAPHIVTLDAFLARLESFQNSF